MGVWVKRFRSVSVAAALMALVLLVLVTAGCGAEKTKANTSGNQVQKEQKEPEIIEIPGSESAANSYIAAAAGEAVIVDAPRVGEISSILKQKSLTPRYVILTHGHFDHIAGLEELVSAYPELTVLIHQADREMLSDPGKNLSTLFGTKVTSKVRSKTVGEGEIIKAGGFDISVVETPGHSPGSICLRVGKILFSGDTLFKGAVGRTDFPGSDAGKLARSLKKLSELPDDTRVLSGHGDETTIGLERELSLAPLGPGLERQ